MATAADLWDWALFWTIVGAMLMLDLFVSRRRGHAGLRTATVWSAVWIAAFSDCGWPQSTAPKLV